ncbi:MAG: hypothetical protein J3K34DRAFT_470387 [Monoraphidium minutum]|nr:MAG: hypothetical protein J3K34DRAFT_470387 [Monoraphidium minutum]
MAGAEVEGDWGIPVPVVNEPVRDTWRQPNEAEASEDRRGEEAKLQRGEVVDQEKLVRSDKQMLIAYNTERNRFFGDYYDFNPKWQKVHEVVDRIQRDVRGLECIATEGGTPLLACVPPTMRKDIFDALNASDAVSVHIVRIDYRIRNGIAVDVRLATHAQLLTAAQKAAYLARRGQSWRRHRQGHAIPVNVAYPRNYFRRTRADKARWHSPLLPNLYTFSPHRQGVRLTIAMLEDAIRVLQQMQGQGTGGVVLQIVTGQGKHTFDGKSYLRAAVLRYLASRGLWCGCEVGNLGAVLIPLGGCQPPPQQQQQECRQQQQQEQEQQQQQQQQQQAPPAAAPPAAARAATGGARAAVAGGARPAAGGAKLAPHLQEPAADGAASAAWALQQQQPEGPSPGPAAASSSSRGSSSSRSRARWHEALQEAWGGGDGDADAWADAASAGFGRRSSVGAGLLSPRGRLMFVRDGSLGLTGSCQLLGSAAPSEPALLV